MILGIVEERGEETGQEKAEVRRTKASKKQKKNEALVLIRSCGSSRHTVAMVTLLDDSRT